jgi:hypothetical protein
MTIRTAPFGIACVLNVIFSIRCVPEYTFSKELNDAACVREFVYARWKVHDLRNKEELN